MKTFTEACAALWRVYVLCVAFVCTLLMYILTLGTVQDVLRDTVPRTPGDDKDTPRKTPKGWTTRKE